MANQVDFKILPSDQFNVYSPQTRSEKVITYFTLLSKLRGDILAVSSQDDPNSIVSAYYTNVGNTQTLHLVKADGSEVTASNSFAGTVTSVDMSVPTGFAISGNPITTSGTLAVSFASGYSLPTNALQATWTTAYNRSITSAAVTGTSTKTLTLNQQDGGTVTASWTDQGLTSVGLTMPAAFNVANSPLTSNGTIAVTAAGLSSQYIRGDGQLANFPSAGGGGSAVNYYLNGSVNQGTFGGTTYYQMSRTPISGAGTNFTRTSAQGDGYVASFITDAGDPDLLNIPGGNWNLEFYFNSSSSGGAPAFYGDLYKVSASNVFTLISSGSTNAEIISGGTTVDQYYTSIAVPQTTLLSTDRLAIRVYVIVDGRNITLHTEDNNFSEVITTFSTGLNALNGLTDQVQYFATGTSGTDFNISSATDTHTFNIPTASGTNRGLLSSSDWTTFNNKASDSFKTIAVSGQSDVVADSATDTLTFEAGSNIVITTDATNDKITITAIGGGSGSVTSVDMSVPTGFAISGNPITTSGTLALAFASGYSLPTNASQANWDTAYNNSITAFSYNTSTGVLTLTQQDAGTLTATVTLQPFTTDNLTQGSTNLYDKIVSLTGAGTTVVTGTYPNFTITSNDQHAGTVTSIATSAPITGGTITTSGTIGITQSGAAADGYLSSTDWNTFNSKVGGSGTVNYVSKWTSTGAIGNSQIFDSGTYVGINTATPAAKLDISGAHVASIGLLRLNSSASNVAAQTYYIDGVYKAATYAGTDDNFYILGRDADIVFSTTSSTTTRMVITNGGNVGIGTSGPTQKLMVSGSIRVTGGYYDSSNSIGSNGQVLASTGSGTTWINASGGTVNGSGTVNYLSKWTGTTLLGDSQLFDNGTNVGIGTATPAAKLDVSGNVRAAAALISQGGNNSWTGAAIFMDWQSTYGRIGAYNYATSAWMPISLNDNSIYITGANGNVGLGTTAPGVKLEVAGGIRATTSSGQIDVDPTSGAFRFYDGTTFRGGLGTGGWASVGATSDIVQYLNGVNYYISNGSTALVKVEPTGKVGIGTTSPSTKLSVSGSDDVASTGVIEIITSGGTNLKIGGNTTYSWIQSHNSSPLYINQLGNNLILNLGGGNVGIGTASPGYKLDVSAAARVYGVRIGRDFSIANRATVRLDSNGDAPADILFGQTAAANQADWTGVYWSISSRNSGAGAAEGNKFTIWRGDAHSAPNNSESQFITITPGLNLGIGETSPTQKIHVSGNIRVTGAYYDSANAAGTSGQILSSTGSGTAWISAPSGGITGSGTTNYVTKWTSGTAVGDSIMYDAGTGIGVGTTTPLLTNPGRGNLTVNGSSDAIMTLGIGGSWASYWYVNSTAAYLSAGNPRALVLEAGNSARVFITSGGNVGIGTTAPYSNLEVTSTNIAWGEGITVNPSPSGYSATFYRVEGTSGSVYTGTWAIGKSSSSEPGGESFQIVKNGLTGSTAYRVDAAQQWKTNGDSIFGYKVGIGTTSPSELLDVNASSATTGYNDFVAFRQINGTGTHSRILFGQASTNNMFIEAANQDNIKGNLILQPYGGNVGIGTADPIASLDNQGSYGTYRQRGLTTMVTNNLGAAGTQAKRFEIARASIDYNDWNTVGPIEVELYERYYSRGLKKKYVIYYGYVSASGCNLVEMTGSGDNQFMVSIGPEVVISGDNRYIPIYVDVRYYSQVTAVVKTNRELTLTNPPGNGSIWMNNMPIGVDISDFTPDSTVYVGNIIGGNSVFTTGNVGIGTTTPNYTFDVTGAQTYTARIYSNSTDTRLLLHNSVSGGGVTLNGGLLLGLVGSDTYFYNYQNGPAIFGTNGSERMRITAAGNVGIGNTAPSQLLHVSGNIRVTGAYYDSANSAGTSGQILSSTGTGTAWIAAPSGGGVSGSGTTNYVTKWTSGSAVGNSSIYDNGNVGIGTTAPGATLTVGTQSSGTDGSGVAQDNSIIARFGASNAGARVTGATIANTATATVGNDATLSFIVAGHYSATGLISAILKNTSVASTDMAFSVYDGGMYERMRITAGGNVGIGTTSPNKQLTFAQANDDAIQIRRLTTSQGNTSLGTGISWTWTSAGTDNETWAAIRVIMPGNGNTNMTFSTTPSNGASGLTERMRITDTGNVLIGTTADNAYRLRVSGKGYFENNVVITPTSESWAEGLSFVMPTTGTWGGLRWRRERVGNDGNWYIGFTALDFTDDLVFGANNGGTQVNNIIRLTKAGNVGIGTATPGARLTVDAGAGTPAFNNGIAINTGNGTYTSGHGGILQFQNEDVITAAIRGVRESGWGSGLALYTHNTSSGNTFGTTVVERMRIAESGNVGIGTTAPGYKLDVSGTAYISDDLLVGATNATSWHRISVATGGFIAQDGGRGIGAYVDSTAAEFFAYNYSVGSYIPLTIRTSTLNIANNGGSSIIYHDGTNVGIGTTAPLQKLHVAGKGLISNAGITGTPSWANNSFEIQSSSGQTVSLEFHRAGFTSSQIWSTGNNLIFGTASGTERMRVQDDNVGIGTSSPQARLHVSGTVSYGSARFSPSSATGESAIAFYDDVAGTATSTSWVVGQAGWGHTGDFVIGNENGGAGGNVRLLIERSGNVGIGTTSPGYRLDVSGTIRATGDVIAYSDARVKENVETLDGALDKVMKMRGVSYNKIGEQEKKVGVIAQEILEVLPEVVSQDESGTYSVAYGNISAVLIEAIKELTNTVKEQQKQIDELKAKLK